MTLHEKARRLIPGGSQLLSKRPETFLPGGWPAYYQSAKGPAVVDLEGRTLIDVSLFGVGACPLGYADPDVDDAVIRAVRAGTMTTLNCPEEVELAELLIELHPWAEMVRYARTGGEAMAIAVRIARAATGRTRVAFCGYHGWHDWYLAANLRDSAALDGHLLPQLPTRGVPPELEGTVVPFASGDLDGLRSAVRGAAAVVMEPARYALPEPGYLEAVKSIAAEAGAVLIFDEITSGFRMHPGGLHMKLGVEPDAAVFAKGMSNGYAMAAIVGRRAVMEAFERTFVSSTYWTERVGPAAALATITKLRAENVAAHLCAMGERMRAGWRAADDGIAIKGLPPLPSFAFTHEKGKALHTLYTQYMLASGYLASGAFYASWAHDAPLVDAALEASASAFEKIRAVVAEDRIDDALEGPVAHTGLRS